MHTHKANHLLENRVTIAWEAGQHFGVADLATLTPICVVAKEGPGQWVVWSCGVATWTASDGCLVDQTPTTFSHSLSRCDFTEIYCTHTGALLCTVPADPTPLVNFAAASHFYMVKHSATSLRTRHLLFSNGRVTEPYRLGGEWDAPRAINGLGALEEYLGGQTADRLLFALVNPITAALLVTSQAPPPPGQDDDIGTTDRAAYGDFALYTVLDGVELLVAAKMNTSLPIGTDLLDRPPEPLNTTSLVLPCFPMQMQVLSRPPHPPVVRLRGDLGWHVCVHIAHGNFAHLAQ